MDRFLKKTPDKDKKKKSNKRSRVDSPPEASTMESHSDSGEKHSALSDPDTSMSAILTNINKKLDKLDSIENKVENIESTISDLKQSVEEALKSSEEAKSIALSNRDRCDRLEQYVMDLKQENVKLNARLDTEFERNLRLESQSRRINLNLDSVPEENDEKPETTIRIFRKVMQSVGVPNYNEIPIERCHRRAGPKGKPRPIIVKFSFFRDREIVWSLRDEFRQKGFWLRQDFPAEYEARRAKFKPILKAAGNDPRYNKKGQVYINVDRLVVDGKVYHHNNLESLPDGLKPSQIATRVANSCTLFYSMESPFSNFYPSPISIDGKDYNCVEQYFQASKASFFDDDNSHQKIMQAAKPHDQYKAGKQIRNFDDKQWRPSEAIKCMEKALEAKFTQNPGLKNALLATDGTDLVECSPHDKFWGTGFNMFHTYAAEPSRWSGQNNLGRLLTNLRQKLI